MAKQESERALSNGKGGSKDLAMTGLPTDVQDKYTILQLTRTKTSLQESNDDLMRQIEETRDIIVQHIIGDARVSANSSTFQHVPLPKLVQVLLRRPSRSKSIKDVHCLSEKPKRKLLARQLI